MSPPSIYNMIIEPLRGADAATRFLYAFLLGPQRAFEQMENKIKELPMLQDPRACRDDLLVYLKAIVGFDRTLDYMTSGLDANELRRLITIAIPLWKERGTRQGLLDIFRAFTGRSTQLFTWIETRFLLDEDHLDYMEPWLIGKPGGPEYSEFWSDLMVMDEGDLDRLLARRVVDLARPLSERIRIIYLDFLDDFLFESGYWIDPGSAAPAVMQEGDFYFPDTGDSFAQILSLRSEDWTEYNTDIIFKLEGNLFGIYFYWEDATINYYLEWDRSGDFLRVARTYPAHSGIVASIPAPNLINSVKYKFTISVFEDIGGTRIRIYLDNALLIDTLDTGTRPSKGTLRLYGPSGTKVWIDRVLLYETPLDYDDVTP